MTNSFDGAAAEDSRTVTTKYAVFIYERPRCHIMFITVLLLVGT